MTARDQWLEARRGAITGTDVAAILGVHPYRNALDVYLEKIGQAEPVTQNEAMWWGTYLEAGIARRYQEITALEKEWLLRGAAIATCWPKKRTLVFDDGTGDAQVLVRHPEHPWWLGTPDGIVQQPGVDRTGLEVKTASAYIADEWGEPGTDQVPLHYLTQCAWYMGATQISRWDVCVLIGGNRLGVYTVKRNEALEAKLCAEAQRFWKEHVQAKVPPPIDGSEQWAAYLGKLHAKATGVVMDASDEVRSWVDRYRDGQKREKQAKVDVQLARNKLAAILGDADKCKAEFGTVGWVRPADSNETDFKALALSLQPTEKQIAEFTKITPNTPYVRGWWSKEAKA